MARHSIAALATVAMLAGCAPTGDGAEAEAAGGADAGRQALLTINHLEPRPDFVGPQPARFTWTPIAGADRYAIGLVSEIDTVVWQRADIPAAEIAWPAGARPAGRDVFLDDRRLHRGPPDCRIRPGRVRPGALNPPAGGTFSWV